MHADIQGSSGTLDVHTSVRKPYASQDSEQFCSYGV